MNTLVLIMLALAIVAALIFLIIVRRGKVQPKELDCGGEEEFENEADEEAQFAVVVDQACGDEIRILVGSGDTWQDKVVERPPLAGTEVRRENPRPGSAYFVRVPKGEKLKVICPPGTRNNKCVVRVANLSRRPTSAIRVTARDTTINPGCGAWTEANLYNLGSKPALVRVIFTSACNDPGGAARPPEIQFKRIVAPNRGQTTAQPAARPDGRQFKWESMLQKDNVIEVRCPGSRGSCNFYVQILG